MEKYLIEEFERLKDIKEKDHIQRFGKLFNTNFSNYFYDTGTGKVVQLDDEEYELFSTLFETGKDAKKFEDVYNLLEKEKQEAILKTCYNENLLRAKKVEDLKLLVGDTDLTDQINHHMEQVALEVTEKCNFRCKYCIYNEDYEGDRNFGTEVMDIEVARKAIDYAMQHSDDTLAVTFYGGEPLLNFNVIKMAIDYALEIGKEKKNLTFSITSNMTLMTRNIAEYLSQVPGLSFMASLDGPESVQNTLDTRMVITALKKAFMVAKPIILNSDQGCQFTSNEYMNFLKENQIRQSMDGKSRWADNIMIERWFRSFKYEEAYLTQYNNIREARKAIGKYVHTYNFERCHSALNNQTPASCYYPILLLDDHVA